MYLEWDTYCNTDEYADESEQNPLQGSSVATKCDDATTALTMILLIKEAP